MLISANANVNAKTRFNRYGMHYAVTYGYIEIIKKLIDAKADIDVIDSSGDTPLMLAIQTNNYDICKLLIEHGANVNINEKPIHQAAVYASFDG